MKFKFFLFFIFSTRLLYGEEQLQKPCLRQPNLIDQQNAITWIPSGGRFGDNLLSYAKALWLARQYDITVLYLPFPYSDKLILHEQENIYCSESKELFSHNVYLPLSSDYTLEKYGNILYFSNWKTPVIIDWFDMNFVNELKQKIAPLYPLDLVAIPDNVISIAVHVRNGGGFVVDTQQEKDRWPLRFLSDEFFITQIERIAEMFDQENIYVHIFTDHIDPAQLVEKFQNILNNPRITFGCREKDNNHKSNVLEDFFSMMNFDCLIRPGSHFSRFVQRLGKNKLVIYPESYYKTINGTTVIDVINVKTRADETERWKTKKIKIA